MQFIYVLSFSICRNQPKYAEKIVGRKKILGVKKIWGGKNVGLKTVSFRGGCITGPNHSGVRLHGFLSYLVKTSLKIKK